MALTNKVCIVTGATRGIGKGIALQLGGAGATVYITGRTLKAPKDAVGGCLEDTAKEIETRGGRCIAVQCDHSKDSDIEKLFERVKREQNGQLDLLVNNAYSAVNVIMENMGKRFWEMPHTAWDEVNNVGLRNHYMCAVYASRLMVPRKNGLIVNISSIGGLRYLFNVPYGIGKEACDRMAADCAMELKKDGISFVSLWPGPVKTEKIMNIVDSGNMQNQFVKVFMQGESTEFSGKCIVHLLADGSVAKKTGKILLTAELGEEYGLTDIDGQPVDTVRSLKGLLKLAGWKTAASFVPRFIKIPFWVLALAGVAQHLQPHAAENVGAAKCFQYIERKGIESRGGRCIPVQCDHSKDSDIEKLFERIKQEQDGKLDLLVNNAFSAVNMIMENMGKKFWELPHTAWDEVNNVGLRNHYLCAVYASRLMVPRKSGLIVNISSFGGLRYLFNVPYGIGKEACDRMAADCAMELKNDGVSFVSLWPGPVKTEKIVNALDSGNMPSKTVQLFMQAESTEFAGKCLVHLLADGSVAKKTGKILLTAELGEEYGLTDIDGQPVTTVRSLSGMLKLAGWKTAASFVPSFLKIPFWVLALAGNKF